MSKLDEIRFAYHAGIVERLYEKIFKNSSDIEVKRVVLNMMRHHYTKCIEIYKKWNPGMDLDKELDIK